MSSFRPCIDLHAGQVKQIVGGSLRDDPISDDAEVREGAGSVVENFVSTRTADWYANLYRRDQWSGGHVIQLGPGNFGAACDALAAFPDGLQLGGGVTDQNAVDWIQRGASHVIVTSFLFEDGNFTQERLRRLAELVGPRRVVVDLSCRRVESKTGLLEWFVATNRWQTVTSTKVTPDLLDQLSGFCDEYLIHAADVEGLCRGVDRELIELLSRHQDRKIVYAGGIASWDDIHFLEDASEGRIDFTVGSALDLFGGTGITYQSLLDRRALPK